MPHAGQQGREREGPQLAHRRQGDAAADGAEPRLQHPHAAQSAHQRRGEGAGHQGTGIDQPGVQPGQARRQPGFRRDRRGQDRDGEEGAHSRQVHREQRQHKKVEGGPDGNHRPILEAGLLHCNRVAETPGLTTGAQSGFTP